jgi:hypothetical protein
MLIATVWYHITAMYVVGVALVSSRDRVVHGAACLRIECGAPDEWVDGLYIIAIFTASVDVVVGIHV